MRRCKGKGERKEEEDFLHAENRKKKKKKHKCLHVGISNIDFEVNMQLLRLIKFYFHN